MRIVIDILSAARGGPGHYIRGLLPHLARRAAGDELHVLAAHPDLIASLPRCANVTIHEVAAGRSAGRRLLWQRFALPGWLRSVGADVIFLPQGLTALRDGPPAVVLHQDMMFLTRERFGRSRCYAACQRHFARMTLQRAARVLFVSRAIQDVAEERGWLRPGRSAIVPHGIDAGELGHADDAGRADDPDARSVAGPSCSAGRPVLLTVGSVMPHKNVCTLLDAVALLRGGALPDARLIIAGEAPDERPAVRDLRQRIAQHGLQQAVTLTGYLPRAKLGPLYRTASMYVSLSRLESFGFTLLEAMACGVPIVCSELPAFHEVCGDAACYVDGGDAPAAARAIESLWRDEPRRRELAARGRDRYALFSWSRVADAVYDVLTSAAREAR